MDKDLWNKFVNTWSIRNFHSFFFINPPYFFLLNRWLPDCESFVPLDRPKKRNQKRCPLQGALDTSSRGGPRAVPRVVPGAAGALKRHSVNNTPALQHWHMQIHTYPVPCTTLYKNTPPMYDTLSNSIQKHSQVVFTLKL